MDEPTLAPGTRFGVYEVVRLLGRGGMGAVYEARHTVLEKVVALKVLARQYASSADACERFVREGKAASRIRHPHIVDVSDLGVAGEQPYLVMEFLEGEDLSHLLEREVTLAPPRIAEILLPVISAVQAAHDAQIVHRDLKPENIFLARTALDTHEPKVLDFGIAKLGGGAKALTGTAVVMGTAYYMSPEQVRGAGDVGPASDQWALGVILYQCVIGTRPFDAENVLGIIHAIGTGAFVAPRVARPSVPAGFESLILRALSMRPEDRFACVRDLGRALFAFADDETRARWAKTFGDASGRHSSESLARASSPSPRVQNAFAQAMTAPAPVAGARGPIPVTGVGVEVERSGPFVVPAPSSPALPSASSPGHETPNAGTFGPVTHAARPSPPSSRAPSVVLGVVVVVGLVVAGVVAMRPRHSSRPTAVLVSPSPAVIAPEIVHVDAAPPAADFALDGRPLGRGAIELALPTDGLTHMLVVSADGYETRSLDVGHGRPPARIELAPSPTLPPGRDAPAPVARGSRAPSAPATELPRTTRRTTPADERGANGALIVE